MSMNRSSHPFFLLAFLLLIAVGHPNTSQAFPKGFKFLEEVNSALIFLADRVRPSVVSISPYIPPSPSVRTQESKGVGRATNAGAGVIVDGDKGLIVTNSHVVRNADKITITLMGGKELIGEVLGMDEDTDIAVVKVESDEPLIPASFGDSSKLKVGQMVVAVGNPYGLNDTLTLGIISGLNRENVNLSRYEDFIQTDASINPGNSGGPLFNIRGEIIGINTAIINYAQSIGFSIPSNMVNRVVGQLIKYGEVQRGWLGVGIEPVSRETREKTHLQKGEGVLVNSVFEGDPAHKAGLLVGDIILKIAGTPVDSPSRMIRIIGSILPGQTVNLDILRQGKAQAVMVKLDNHRKQQRKELASLPFDNIPPLGLEVIQDQSKGVQIAKVYPESESASKGLEKGDIILAVNGSSIQSAEEFDEIIDKISTGNTIFLLVERNQEKLHLALVR
jgi:serine protease Do